MNCMRSSLNYISFSGILRNNYTSLKHSISPIAAFHCSATKNNVMAGELIPEKCLASYKHSFVPSLLDGKVAFITGGGSGIGFRTAEIFMRHGCDTIIASRNIERVQSAAETLSKCTGRKCLYYAMDVRKPETIKKALEDAVGKLGRLDIVINNAAGNFYCPLSAMSPNAFKTVQEIDTQGTFNTSKIAFDTYLRDHGGVILSISATLGYRGDVLTAHAGAAKVAIDALMRHMAVEWGQYNIRAVSVSPGLVTDTEGYNRLGKPIQLMMDQAKSKVPIQRWCTREEVAETLLYLASPISGHITGTTLVCDGGSWLTQHNDISNAEHLMRNVNSKL